jgi:hypothetical protein
MTALDKDPSTIEMHENIELDGKSIGDEHAYGARDQDGKFILNEDGFQTDEDSLPKGVRFRIRRLELIVVADMEPVRQYYYSPNFLGSMLAIGLGFWAGASAFAYVRPNRM